MNAMVLSCAAWWMCMFTTLTLVSGATPTRRDLVTLLLSMGVVTATTWLFAPTPSACCVLAALAAVSGLWQPLLRWRWLSIGLVWALSVRCALVMGMPWWLALIICAALLVLAIWQASQSQFVTTQVRDQALMCCVWVSVCVAAAETVLSGWLSARALNVAAQALPNDAPTAVVGAQTWVWQFVVSAVLAGAIRGWWGRK